VAAGVVLGIFWTFAGDGLHGYFAPDEMMNLYAAWSPPAAQLIHNERPLGALVYRALFSLFGLNPLPYRVVCYALLLANLGLLYGFCARLASREAAALACLLGAYHARLADLYYTSSDIFDLLCFFFFYLALVYYAGIRRGGAWPNLRQSTLILGLYVSALACKEIAVVWPVYAAMFEAIYRRTDFSGKVLREHLVRSVWFWGVTLAITISYVAYKTTGTHRMTSNPDYLPHLTLQAFFAGWKHYLAHLFYSPSGLTDFQIVALFGVMIGLALLLARRELLLAWFMIGIGSLPFLFLNPRGFFVAYVTLPGWYLYAGSLLAWLRETAERVLPPSPGFGARAQQALLFGIVAALLVPRHRAEKPVAAAAIIGDYQTHKKLIGQLASRYPKLPRGARVIFLSDPYPADDYILYFIFALQYRDRDIRVDREKVEPGLIAKTAGVEYAHVFNWGAAGLEEVAAIR